MRSLSGMNRGKEAPQRKDKTGGSIIEIKLEEI